MSKFKVGDRVRLLSDAWSCARKESGVEPRFGRAGEVGVIVEDGGTSDDLKGWYVGEVGQFMRGWFAEEQLEHADHNPPVAHHDRVVADTHAAIDRLVSHLERQATEHVHALDALRAEVEALRTQNAHLRALQAATEAKPVREVVRGEMYDHQAIALDAATFTSERGRFAVLWHDGWSIYLSGAHPSEDETRCLRLTNDQAIAWVLDGVLPTR